MKRNCTGVWGGRWLRSLQSVGVVLGSLLVFFLIVNCQDGTANTRVQRLDLSYVFLTQQMDRFNDAVVVYDDGDYQAFYPSGMMGDKEEIEVDGLCDSSPHRGRYCMKVSYRPESGREEWAGVYFQYPDKNWGGDSKIRGRNLSGATKVSFRARANRPIEVKFLSGGVPDYATTSVRHIKLSENWPELPFEIPLGDENNRESMIAPFGLVIHRPSDGEPVEVFLDEIKIDLSLADNPRLIQSYVPSSNLTGGSNVAHTYDQALALLAYLARGNKDDLRRAGLLADALVLCQEKDRFFHDGRLRNAYACGELVDRATQFTRLPGKWNSSRSSYEEDEYAAGSDTGNLAWSAIALVQADSILKCRDHLYLRAAERIAEWIVKNCRAEGACGGFYGGFEGFDGAARACRFRSTEHNIDVANLCDHLARHYGIETKKGRRWIENSRHAKLFVESMWAREEGGHRFLFTGTVPNEDTVNRNPIPLDVQTWSVLALEVDEFGPAVEWAKSHCRSKTIANTFDFNANDGDGTWWEGSSQMVCALRRMKRHEEANAILRSVERAAEGSSVKGGVPASDIPKLTTGFQKVGSDGISYPWTYPDCTHVGATAWFLFAELGANPYHVNESRSSIHSPE